VSTDLDVSALEARLRALEDERAIQGTLYQYGHSIDYGDEAGWVDCFTEDGVWDVRYRKGSKPRTLCEGRASLASYISGHTRAPAKYHKHVLVEPQIVVDGDSATVDSYFMKVDAQDEGRSEIVAIGRYRDDLVREADGRWRFRQRICEVEDR
jgi:ketosteroid isomerase-like protein